MNDNKNFFDKAHEEELNLYEIINIFFRKKFLIIFITSLSAFLSVFYALNQEDIYESSALLVPNEGSSSQSQSLSGLSSMASLAGINLQSSGTVSKANLTIEIIKSREFFKHISNFDNVYAELTSLEFYDPILKKSFYNEEIYDSSLNEWLTDGSGLTLKPNFYKAYENYLFSLSIFNNNKTGFIHLSFQHQNPEFTKFFTDLIIRELNLNMKNKDLNQSSRAIEYLYDQLTNDSYVAINKPISSMIESNLYTKMMASIDSEYFISIVDAPYVPEFKIAPIRWLICIIGTISGFIVSLILVLLIQYFPIFYRNIQG